MSQTLPYGSWPSPITAAAATAGGILFTDTVTVDGDDLLWVESRPAERGRSALVRRSASGAIDDVGPDDFDTRTRVHEYGGASFAVTDRGVVASRFGDQRLWLIDDEGVPRAITPEPDTAAGVRYADLAVRGTWAIAVRETHPAMGGEPVNDLVRIDLGGGDAPRVISGDHDFVAAPRISPDGTRLAFLAWNHPDMPWDGTEVWLADLAPDGGASELRRLAGGRGESLAQPTWSPEGELVVASDRTGWWNPYRVDGTTLLPLHADEAEWARPMWTLGTRTMVFLDDGRLVAIVERGDGERLAVVDGERYRELDLPFRGFDSLAAAGTTVFTVAAAFDRPTELVAIDIDTGNVETVRRGDDPGFGPGFVGTPDLVTFATPDGPAHAWYHPPRHPDHHDEGSAPPLVVMIHGGPTSRAGMGLNLGTVFWTSRGFAVLDVDHGGSTGRGRAYRDRLLGGWGEVDVRDCALAAAAVAAAGKADPDRMVIRGGSAGGFTVLMALARHQVFAGGMARYPVTDLETLATETHKFESRYLDSLIGPYPQARAVYQDRSPTHHVDEIAAPVLLLQGADDRVVPPSQPLAMAAALRARGVPVAYLEFPGEGHGFRGAEARVRALEAELWFAGRVLGFEPADDLEPVPGL